MAVSAESGPARSAAGLVVFVCLLVAAVEGYDIQAFGIAAPKLVAELGLTPGQQGLAASAAMFGLILGAFAGGWLADRVGRKPVLLGSVALFGLFCVGTAMSHAYGPLLAMRIATGLGLGGAMPNLVAIATEVSPPGRRALTVTAVVCGMPAGGTVVSILARALGPGLDWRTLFFAGGLAPLLLLPLVMALLPETRPEPDAEADRRVIATLFGDGRAARTLLLWAGLFLALLIIHLNLNWLPTLVIAKGLPPQDGFAAAIAFNVFAVIGTVGAGAAVDRFGFRWPLVATFLGLAAALAGMAVSTAAPQVIALAALCGLACVGGQFGLLAVAPGFYPPHMRGLGSGAAVAMGRWGSVAGPLVAGALRDSGHSASFVLAALAPVALAAAAATFGLGLLAKRPASLSASA